LQVKITFFYKESNMTHYVQVVGNEVKQVWDTPPAEGVGNNGWKNAVEVRPAITAHRQGYTAHRFDLTTDPVQIIWDTYDIPVADRKAGMIANANMGFQMEMQRQAMNPANYDPAALAAAQAAIAPKVAAINAATTHDDLDALL
jgi:hypothetical protein